MIALPLILLHAAAAGGGDSNEAQMARCAWAEAASTSATLVARARFDRQYRYDADGSPTIGPIMRIRAACWGQSKDFPARSGKPLSALDLRKFLKRLAASKPSTIAADRYAGRVRRCEFQFLDAPSGAAAAAVVWTIELGDGSDKEISRSEELRGFASAAEILAAISPSNGGADLLSRAGTLEPLRVATIKAGTESGKPFAVDMAAAKRSCRLAKSDGSYEDA